MIEECGVVGIASNGEAAPQIYYALRAIQHRGQESAGISIFDNVDKKMRFHKGMGLVEVAISPEQAEGLKGNIGIGHVRYSTAGSSRIENAQPIIVSTQHGDIALGHNWDIVNADAIRNEKKKSGWAFITETDSEVIIRLFADELSKNEPVRAMGRVMKYIVGSYALVIMVNGVLFAVRDPNGIKPLCIGKLSDGYIAASESAALDVLGAELVRDVHPGEMVELKPDGISSYQIVNPDKVSHCMFEYVYFSRDDSILDGRLAHDVRIALGRKLAEDYPVNADIVVPVPDSGRTYATGYSNASGIPLDDALIS